MVPAAGKKLSVSSLPPIPEDLPESGKPAIMGPVKVQAELSKTELTVGEPVTLTLTFSDVKNTDFSIPPLGKQQALENGFSIPAERSPGKNEQGKRIFVQTIRAADDSPEEFPALSFPVFNTESGEWETVSTDAVPINVLPTRVADSGDLEVWNSEGPAIRDLEYNDTGLAASYPGTELLFSARPGNYPWMHPVLFYIILILPPGLWVLLLLRRKSILTLGKTGSGVFRKFLKQWKKKSMPLSDFEKALDDYVFSGNVTGLGRMGIYGLKEVPGWKPGAIETFRQLAGKLERLLYAPDKPEEPDEEHRLELHELGQKLLKETAL